MGHLVGAGALGFVNLFGQLYSRVEHIHIFAGPDLNGAIALAVSRLLRERHYKLSVYLFYGQGYIDETEEELRQARDAGVSVSEISRQFTPPQIQENELIIDGIFGSELMHRVEGGFEQLIAWINSLEREVVSIDLPSGLFADDNSLSKPQAIIRAKRSIGFESPKLVMLLGEYASYIGTWHLVPLGISAEVHQAMPTTQYNCLSEQVLARVLLPRKSFTQVRDYGYSLMIGGCEGLYGRLALAGQGLLLTGCATLDVATDREGHTALSLALPEARLLRPSVEGLRAVPQELKAYQSIVVGLCMQEGDLAVEELRHLFTAYRKPLVLAGEAIRLLVEHPSLLDVIPTKSILMLDEQGKSSLLGEHYTDLNYLELAQSYASRHRLNIVLSGHYTAVIADTGKAYFSTSGNAGMLRSAMYELLVALVAGLVARGYDELTASLLAVYVWGAAGDNYVGRYSMETLRPTALLGEIPTVLSQLYS